MVIHDLKCTLCGHEYYDQPVNVDNLPRCTELFMKDEDSGGAERLANMYECGAPLEIRWDISRRSTPLITNNTTHKSELAVVFRHPVTGSTAYPGVNNRPMPERYRRAGYETVELNSLSKLDKFCKEKNLINEAANFDRSGHADDL